MKYYKFYKSTYLKKIANTLTSKQIWQKDKTKIDYALSNNFEILVIWEKDYRNNKENIIN